MIAILFMGIQCGADVPTQEVLQEVSSEETLEPKKEHEPPREMGMTGNVLSGSIDRISLEVAIGLSRV